MKLVSIRSLRNLISICNTVEVRITVKGDKGAARDHKNLERFRYIFKVQILIIAKQCAIVSVPPVHDAMLGRPCLV